MQVELIADYSCKTGENPLWHPTEKRLYWTDIPNGRIFRYDPATNTHQQCYEGEVVGGFTIQADGALLLFMACGAVKIWRDGELSTIISEMPEERDNRFNDAIADPAGRVFCGVMSTAERAGRLYRMETDGTITAVVEGIGTSNGMGFTPDRRGMYHSDSHFSKREIYLYDYDQSTGSISNRRLFVRVPEGEGMPDGMTVDADGCVWSARWNGGVLVRYTPDGKEERRIKFPAKKISSVTFGGENYTDIYVTTAGGDNKSAEGAGAGALFRVNLGIRGVPEFPSGICL